VEISMSMTKVVNSRLELFHYSTVSLAAEYKNKS
jgi:hypothetical protein